MFATEIFSFIQTKDLRLSQTFYEDLGFEIDQELEDSVRFQSGDFGFYLQQIPSNVPLPSPTLQLVVQDFESLYETVKKLSGKYPFLALSPIRTVPTGSLFFFKGPSGETWRVMLPNRRF